MAWAFQSMDSRQNQSWPSLLRFVCIGSALLSFSMMCHCGAKTGLVVDEAEDAGTHTDVSLPDAEPDVVIDADIEADIEHEPAEIIQVVAGASTTCAVLVDGTLKCWGQNGLGQCGYGTTERIGDDEPASAAVPVLLRDRVAQVVAGYHTCAVLEDRSLWCWGDGGSGKLGYGNQENIGNDELPASAVPVDVDGDVLQVSNGSQHTCALLLGGLVRCWGHGSYGVLGYGSEDNIGDNELPSSVGPVDIGGVAVQVSVGSRHSCALLDDGLVRCWGVNVMLGIMSEEDVGDDELPSSVPTVDLGGRAVQIDAGSLHTCALLEEGSVICWGVGGDDRLGYALEGIVGDDEPPSSVGPVDVGGRVVQISAGGAHTCALLEGGDVRCWGGNRDGQLGYGTVETIGDDELPSSVGPVDVGGRVIQISAGSAQTCALLEVGSIRCWGWNIDGELGYGFGLGVNVNIGDDETPASVGDVPL